MGFPIRKSTGHRLFAPHRSLSQRTTSFIASCRQGIHRMLLGHLIALISNAHLRKAGCCAAHCCARFFLLLLGMVSIAYRKTSLHRDRPNTSLRLASSDPLRVAKPRKQRSFKSPACGFDTHGRRGRVSGVSGISLLHDVKKPPLGQRRKRCSSTFGLLPALAASRARHLVEPDGIEPTTSCLQSRRSPN